MMQVRFSKLWLVVLLAALLAPATSWAQSYNATITGVVTDPSAAAVPGVALTLTSVATGKVATATSGPDGTYTFPNLLPGGYELKATSKGFRDYVQRGISVLVNQVGRIDVKLELGAESQTMEVVGSTSVLNFEDAVQQAGITPETISQLPLIVGSRPRSAAAFVILTPGVTTGAGASPFDARINGGLESGDEAIVDGISMQQGLMSQSGMISIYQDFGYSPDMVSEIKVLSGNYEPQYGSTTSANIIANTKSGTNEFHGTAYEFYRGTVLNARQWGAEKRTRNLKNDLGASIGGPAKVKGLWSDKRKTYFFVNFEAFRDSGGASAPIISIPSLKERQGDFTDWVDDSGKLIPVYDPATTRVVGGKIVRDQFMGCDGKTPNVICSSDPRLANSLANAWIKFLPTPTNDKPINNYRIPKPIPDSLLAATNNWLVRADHNIGDKDHFFVSIYYQGAGPVYNTQLPEQLANETYTAPQFAFVNRMNWDHTFSPTLLNHFAGGYLNRNEGYGSINEKYVKEFPEITGVAGHDAGPVVGLDGFTSMGNNNGPGSLNVTARPAYIFNDLLTWVKGKHTLKFGGEYRNLGENNRGIGGQSGTFNFSRGATSLLGINSGSSVASWLLGAVDNANATFYAIQSNYPRADTWIAHFGDTWKVTPKISFNYGIRWDMARPSAEKWDRMSFFDPTGANPAAGGRPGRLAFAGDQWGAASYGSRHPEFTWKKGFAPRIGIAYALNDKTVIRTGYGIFYTQMFYSGWGGGVTQNGFQTVASFGSKDSGQTPAFYWQEGFPQDFQKPPVLDASLQNGRGIYYRGLDGNRLPYSQQWNLSIERELSKDTHIGVAYVGNKGTRMPSTNVPLNALDPKYLSMGSKLNDSFEPGMTELDGVPIPYPGWVEQMKDCSPSVAQALLPYPQYCDQIRSHTENAGNNTYHSFQFKAERRFSGGLYFLGAYTFSKLIGDSDHPDQPDNSTTDTHGLISPFERQRNKVISRDDVPQVLSISLVYDLPFGRGKQFLNTGGVSNALLGGWQVSSTFRKSSAVPLLFSSDYCNVPGQFQAACIPAIIPGKNVFLQDWGSLDVNKPMYNKDAFESIDQFNYYYGKGSPTVNLRGQGYLNNDIALLKETKFGERFSWQVRAEFFNAWNWHRFTGNGVFGRSLGSSEFALWGGSVTDPRVIQVGTRITF